MEAWFGRGAMPGTALSPDFAEELGGWEVGQHAYHHPATGITGRHLGSSSESAPHGPTPACAGYFPSLGLAFLAVQRSMLGYS